MVRNNSSPISSQIVAKTVSGPYLIPGELQAWKFDGVPGKVKCPNRLQKPLQTRQNRLGAVSQQSGRVGKHLYAFSKGVTRKTPCSRYHGFWLKNLQTHTYTENWAKLFRWSTLKSMLHAFQHSEITAMYVSALGNNEKNPKTIGNQSGHLRTCWSNGNRLILPSRMRCA